MQESLKQYCTELGSILEGFRDMTINDCIDIVLEARNKNEDNVCDYIIKELNKLKTLNKGG